jgi:hypothetical protein
MMILPTHEPPSDRRAGLAVGLAPLFVAVVFGLIVSGLVAFDTVWEMLGYQRALDAYNQQVLQGPGTWRTADAAASSELEPSSDFVRSLIGAGRGPTLWPDQPQP